MGDRANIYVYECDGEPNVGVFLYAHWSGSSLPLILQEALKRHERWNDPAYLTRIIFCHMVKGEEMDSTGYGISTSLQDGSDRVLRISAESRKITRNDGKSWTFEEYLTVDPGTVWYGETEYED